MHFIFKHLEKKQWSGWYEKKTFSAAVKEAIDGLSTSYTISLLIANLINSHTIGEELILLNEWMLSMAVYSSFTISQFE